MTHATFRALCALTSATFPSAAWMAGLLRWRPPVSGRWRGLVAGCLALGLGAAHAAPFAYLTSNSSTVRVFDLATQTTSDVVLPGPVGNGVAVNRQGTRVYLAGVTARGVLIPSLQVIDATTQAALPAIALNGPSGASWAGVAVNPSGDRVYVANPDGRYVAVVDPDTRQVVNTITLTGKPANLVFSPDGSRLYVSNGSNGNGDSISVIDPQTQTVVASVAVSNGPSDLSFNPQGTRLYVTHPQSNVLSVIDTTSHRLLSTLPLSFSPVSAVVSRDGSKLYVSDYSFNGAQVAVFDTRTNALLRSIPVGNRSTGIAITPDGRSVLVVNFLSNNVSVIDTATDTVTATVAVSNVVGPFYGAFISPDTRAVGPSPTGTGTVGLSLNGGGSSCRVTNPSFTTAPGTPPAGMRLVHGVVSFTATPCTNGARVTVTLTYPSPVPDGAVLYKYGRTAASPAQAVYTPVAATVSGNTLSYTIEDGGVGDEDLTVNGQIVDPVGLGVPLSVLAGLAAVPTLSEWGLLLMASLMVLAVAVRGRRPG